MFIRQYCMWTLVKALLWEWHRENTPLYTYAVTSIWGRRLLQKMTNLMQFSLLVLAFLKRQDLAKKRNILSFDSYWSVGSMHLCLSQPKLCTSKTELSIEMKLYVDVHQANMTMAMNAGQRKWRQIRTIAMVSQTVPNHEFGLWTKQW